jgi:hypothetical protein
MRRQCIVSREGIVLEDFDMTTSTRWLARVTLGIASLILLLVGSKYVFDSASAAAASGLAFLSPFGRTNMRAGVGGFSLGGGLIMLACVASTERLHTGLWFVVGVFAPVLVVRLYGVVADGTFAESRTVLAPETLTLALAFVSLASSRRSRVGAGA